MSFGKMNCFIDIVIMRKTKDPEGFATTAYDVVASVRAYREGRHGSQRWANLAAFSEATDLFRFRCIPDVTVTTDHIIYSGGEKFDITSVEDVKGAACTQKCWRKRWWRPMAKAEVQLPEEMLTRLSQLGTKSDEIAEKMLEAGGEVLLSRVKSNLAGVIGKGTKYPSESTGELERSLGLSPAKLDRDGNHNIKVGFSEPRSDGGSNAQIANIIEYGKHGQPAKPFLKPAKSASKSAVIEQ